MARNKYPEETVKKILNTAISLFLENGYEKTSMQDIVNALGMSKGAIYHHFKSKEELFERAVLEFYARDDRFDAILKDETTSGLEKLRAMFRTEMADEEKLAMDQLYFTQISDPRVFMEHMRLNIVESGPEVAKVIEQGNRDGSLQVEYPLETAELILMMANVWIGLFGDTRDKFERQVRVCQTALEALGIPLIEETMISLLLRYYDRTLLWAHDRLEREAPQPRQGSG